MSPDGPKISDIMFGYSRLVRTRERRGDRIYLGGYSVLYGRDGNEVSRTENQWNVIVDCGDERTARHMEVQP